MTKSIYFMLVGCFIYIFAGLVNADEKNNNSQDNSVPIAESQQNTKSKNKGEANKTLTCSKQARRIHKIKDRTKRREFIKKCRAEREAKEQAERDKKTKAKAQKKAEEKQIMKDFLN